MTEHNEQTGNAANRAKRASVMELETLHAERAADLEAQAEVTERESRVAQCHELIGRIQGVKMVADFGNVAGFSWLKDVHKDKLYKDMPGVGTWEKFCKLTGISRRKIEDGLRDLESLGEDFLGIIAGFRVSSKDIRKLRQLTHDGAVVIDAEAVTIGEERIPLNADHAEDLQAAIEQILEEKADIKKRVAKLEKDGKAVIDEETKGLHAEVRALVCEVNRLQVFDPEDKDRDWSVEMMEAIKKNLIDFTLSVSKFVIDPRLKGDHFLIAQINGHISEAEMELRSLRERFETDFEIYGE